MSGLHRYVVGTVTRHRRDEGTHTFSHRRDEGTHFSLGVGETKCKSSPFLLLQLFSLAGGEGDVRDQYSPGG